MKFQITLVRSEDTVIVYQNHNKMSVDINRKLKYCFYLFIPVEKILFFIYRKNKNPIYFDQFFFQKLMRNNVVYGVYRTKHQIHIGYCTQMVCIIKVHNKCT